MAVVGAQFSKELDCGGQPYPGDFVFGSEKLGRIVIVGFRGQGGVPVGRAECRG